MESLVEDRPSATAGASRSIDATVRAVAGLPGVELAGVGREAGNADRYTLYDVTSARRVIADGKAIPLILDIGIRFGSAGEGLAPVIVVQLKWLRQTGRVR